MRIILSRKGVDSTSGGIPSPIMPDGTLVPLPIPSRYGPKSYDELKVNGFDLGPLVEDLGGRRLKRNYLCHLDPDLDAGSCSRPRGWRQAFGQMETAQVHLAKQGIGPQDLFLFFGWFKAVERRAAHWCFVPGAPDLHIIYGWLAVGEVLSLGEKPDSPERLAPFVDHPHLSIKDRSPNCLYLAADRLVLDSRELPGAGMFSRLADTRVLTDPSQSRRSLWRLPSWLHPALGEATLTYHESPDRWEQTETGKQCLLASVGRGQEFVLFTQRQDRLADWIASIFAGFVG